MVVPEKRGVPADKERPGPKKVKHNLSDETGLQHVINSLAYIDLPNDRDSQTADSSSHSKARTPATATKPAPSVGAYDTCFGLVITACCALYLGRMLIAHLDLHASYFSRANSATGVYSVHA